MIGFVRGSVCLCWLIFVDSKKRYIACHNFIFVFVCTADSIHPVCVYSLIIIVQVPYQVYIMKTRHVVGDRLVTFVNQNGDLLLLYPSPLVGG